MTQINMTQTIRKVLVVGATGSIGRLAVAEAHKQRSEVRALVRSRAKAKQLSSGAGFVEGGLTRPESLLPAVQDIYAVIFTYGSERLLASSDQTNQREGCHLVTGKCKTIGVRPGWFDYNKGNEHRLEFLQDDTRQTGNAIANDELPGPAGAGYRNMIEKCPAGRAGTPDEVGTVGALLMGAEGAFITGSTICSSAPLRPP